MSKGRSKSDDGQGNLLKTGGEGNSRQASRDQRRPIKGYFAQTAGTLVLLELALNTAGCGTGMVHMLKGGEKEGASREVTGDMALHQSYIEFQEALSAARTAFLEPGNRNLSSDEGRALLTAVQNFYEALGQPIEAELDNGRTVSLSNSTNLEERVTIFNRWLSNQQFFEQRGDLVGLDAHASPNELEVLGTLVFTNFTAGSAAAAAIDLNALGRPDLAEVVPQPAQPQPVGPAAQPGELAAGEGQDLQEHEDHDIGVPAQVVTGDRVAPPPLRTIDDAAARAYAQRNAQDAALLLLERALADAQNDAQRQEALHALLTGAIELGQEDLRFINENPQTRRAIDEGQEIGQMLNVFGRVLGSNVQDGHAPSLLEEARTYLESHQDDNLDPEEVRIRVARIRSFSRALHLLIEDLWPYVMVMQGADPREVVQSDARPARGRDGEEFVPRHAAADVSHALEALASLQSTLEGFGQEINHTYYNALFRLYRSVEDRIPDSINPEVDAVVERIAPLPSAMGMMESRDHYLRTAATRSRRLYEYRDNAGHNFWRRSASLLRASEERLNGMISEFDNAIEAAQASRVDGQENPELDRLLASATALRDYARERSEALAARREAGGSFSRNDALEILELSERLRDASDGLCALRSLQILYNNRHLFSSANDDTFTAVNTRFGQEVDNYVNDFTVANLNLNRAETNHRRSFEGAMESIADLSDVIGTLGFPVLYHHEQRRAGDALADRNDDPRRAMPEPLGHYEYFVNDEWRNEDRVPAGQRDRVPSRWVRAPPTNPPGLEDAEYDDYKTNLNEDQERFYRFVYGIEQLRRLRQREPEPEPVPEPPPRVVEQPQVQAEDVDAIVTNLETTREGDHWRVRITDVRLEMDEGESINLEEYRGRIRRWARGRISDEVLQSRLNPYYNVIVIERVGDRYFVLNPAFADEWALGNVGIQGNAETPRYLGEVVFPEGERARREQGGVVYRVDYNDEEYVRRQGDDNVLFNVFNNFRVVPNERFRRLITTADSPFLVTTTGELELPATPPGVAVQSNASVHSYYRSREQLLGSIAAHDQTD